MMGLLEGKIAIVTGAGRGIGAAAAQLFAQHGAQVVVNDLDMEPAHAVAREIQAAGGNAITVIGDLTLPDVAQRLVDDTLAQFGTIDIMVNNAGYTWDSMLHTMSDDQWQAMLDIHLTAPFRLMRACAQFLRMVAKQEQSTFGVPQPRKIINVTSTSGIYGNVGQANYASAKAGVVGFTKTLAKEWGRFNIQTNALCYGFIDTRLTAEKESGTTIERDGQAINLGVPGHLRAGFSMFHPMSRPGTVEEAAGPMLFLASPLSNYVNGAVVEVTGGMAL